MPPEKHLENNDNFKLIFTDLENIVSQRISRSRMDAA